MANDSISTIQVKNEPVERNLLPRPNPTRPSYLIELSSSSDSDDSSSSDDDDNTAGNLQKKFKRSAQEASKLLPPGFLDPLPSKQTPLPIQSSKVTPLWNGAVGNKQFWKAGDYEGSGVDWNSSSGTCLITSLCC